MRQGLIAPDLSQGRQRRETHGGWPTARPATITKVVPTRAYGARTAQSYCGHGAFENAPGCIVFESPAIDAGTQARRDPLTEARMHLDLGRTLDRLVLLADLRLQLLVGLDAEELVAVDALRDVVGLAFQPIEYVARVSRSWFSFAAAPRSSASEAV